MVNFVKWTEANITVTKSIWGTKPKLFEKNSQVKQNAMQSLKT